MNNSKSQIGQDKILDQEIFRGKTNGVFVDSQFGQGPKDGTVYTKNIGGFMFGFTKEHYHKYKFNNSKL